MHQGAERLPAGAPVWPQSPGRLVYRSVGRQAARPPSSGWAKATFGVSSRTPCADRSVPVKNGEAPASGWTAEQTS